jgi:putative flippase GtrA
VSSNGHNGRTRALWGRSLHERWALWRTNKLFGQSIRFALSGVAVSIVYITITTLLAEASHLDFQLALAIGWCSAVSIHFTLQRVFVWAHEDRFALPLSRQVRRYMLVALLQLGATVVSTAVLPSVLGLPAEAIYLMTAVVLTLINFVVFRNGIFHHDVAAGGAIELCSHELVD